MIDEDLTALSAYRADVPPPTPAAWQSARSALMEATERQAAGSNAACDNGDLATLGRWRGSRRLGIRVGVAVVAAVLAILVAATLRSGSPAGPVPAAAQVLNRLAAVAASQPQAASAIEGQYVYTLTQSVDANNFGKCALLVPKERERWIAPDGSGVIREREGDKPKFLSEADRSRCARVLASIGSEIGGPTERRYVKGCMSPAPIDLSKLPTEPTILRGKLETGKVEGGPPGPGEAFTQIGDLLRNTDASPALRAALYKAAEGLSGVQSLGEVTDRAGRRGIGLAIVDRHLRHEMIFDPHTSALMADRETIADTRTEYEGPVGAVIEQEAYWPPKIVTTIPASSNQNTVVHVVQCHEGMARMVPSAAQRRRPNAR